jgi:transcription initiation factor TFIIH subunit 3
LAAELEGRRSPLSAAIAAALCFLQRLHRQRAVPGDPGAILLVSPAEAEVGPDAASGSGQYVGLMNASFAAAKLGVRLHCAPLAVAPAAFLLAAPALTGGRLCRLPGGAAGGASLLAALLYGCGGGPEAGLRAGAAQTGAAETRPACACHRRPVAAAHCCSVCLALRCRFAPVCASCGTKLAFPVP